MPNKNPEKTSISIGAAKIDPRVASAANPHSCTEVEMTIIKENQIQEIPSNPHTPAGGDQKQRRCQLCLSSLLAHYLQVPPETLDQTLGMLTRAIYRKDQYIGFALGRAIIRRCGNKQDGDLTLPL